jgi:hypothetical protein
MGQEYAGHLDSNPNLFIKQKTFQTAKKTTAADPLMLPFFEDFTGYGLYPDSSKWTDYHVYVNNTMGNRPISRGVATFDALDWRGIPYDSFNNANFRYADTLTSQPINLSLDVVSPADSIYLSFFYQPQGNGFFPLSQDSLMLFLKTRFGGYVKVWSIEGSSLHPFRQVMIPIADSLYFDSFFQFRFINIGALYWADAIWNVDYVRLGAGRTVEDTTINDIGFSSSPSYFLNDYTSMPYRQFFGYSSFERATQYTCSLRNNYDFSQTAIHGYDALGLNTGTVLKPVSWSSAAIAAAATQSLSFPAYTSLLPLSVIGNFEKVTFRNKYYIQSISTSDPPANDTVEKDFVFDNYLAYDDGTAEKSYYLNLYPTLPGKIAIEYHLNKPDTMRGMAIYFGRQVPFAFNKLFDIDVYATIAGVNGAAADNLLYTQELCYPGYVDSINHFFIYKFDKPLPLPAGTFFAGTFQPAESGSDSLYFGLDVNRIGPNHAYYNVVSSWVPSLISGAIMMRPLLGQEISGTSVLDIANRDEKWQISPNPATNRVSFDFEGDERSEYTISDIHGRKVMEGNISSGKDADISALLPGMYFVRLVNGEVHFQILKFVKL